MKLIPPFASSVLAAALVSGAALASGNHPGGHDHDRDAISKPKGTVKVTGKAGAPKEAGHAGHRH